jgi:murein DD-endopeptidase MepM/ murein hydrolase activator NlpD
LPLVPVRPSTYAKRSCRGTRSTAVALAIVLPAAVVTTTSASVPLPLPLPLSRSASEKAIPMAYDRDDVGRLNAERGAERRAMVTAWFALATRLDASAEQQRASRGEPRRALAGEVAHYWRPTDGNLTQPFHPGHKGIDIGVPVGTPVLAAADGVVTFVGQQSGYGNHVEIRDTDGSVTTYSHLSAFDATVGQPVKAGQLVARSGNTGHSTGPHLHFEVKLPDAVTVIDPLTWLAQHGA